MAHTGFTVSLEKQIKISAKSFINVKKMKLWIIIESKCAVDHRYDRRCSAVCTQHWVDHWVFTALSAVSQLCPLGTRTANAREFQGMNSERKVLMNFLRSPYRLEKSVDTDMECFMIGRKQWCWNYHVFYIIRPFPATGQCYAALFSMSHYVTMSQRAKFICYRAVSVDFTLNERMFNLLK